MGILAFIILAAILGVGAWALVTYVPMPGAVKTIIVAAVVIALILIFLAATGIIGDGSISDVKIPEID